MPAKVSKTPRKKPSKPVKRPPSRRERAARRLAVNNARADKLFPAEPPDDADQFRLMLARRIAMFIGNRKEYWRGCREPCCRRARACIAPDFRCSQVPPLKPDPDGRRLARTLAMVQRAVAQAIEEVGGEG